MTDKKLIEYAYNNEYFQSVNPPKHKQVVNKKHDPYIEAIVGAVYYDAGSIKRRKDNRMAITVIGKISFK